MVFCCNLIFDINSSEQFDVSLLLRSGATSRRHAKQSQGTRNLTLTSRQQAPISPHHNPLPLRRDQTKQLYVYLSPRSARLQTTMNSVRAATSASRTALTASARTAAPRRAFSQSQTKRSGHGPSYDPPSGWLFGVKPGEQYEKEGWENAMYWGFGGACAFGVVAYAFKPDTRYVQILCRREMDGDGAGWVKRWNRREGL